MDKLAGLFYVLQAVVRGLLPGLKYLGFIADALIRLLMGQLARKYQSATAATSVDKVSSLPASQGSIRFRA